METKNIEIRGLTGVFDLKLYGPDGILKDFRHVKNLTVNDGFDTVGEMMGQETGQPAGFQRCAIGTDGTTPGVSQTTLFMENARATGGYTGTSDTVWKNDATFTAGMGTGAIRESGLFNGASPATMLCRQTFAVINKGADDTLVVTWQYTLS